MSISTLRSTLSVETYEISYLNSLGGFNQRLKEQSKSVSFMGNQQNNESQHPGNELAKTRAQESKKENASKGSSDQKILPPRFDFNQATQVKSFSHTKNLSQRFVTFSD
jgi:hypothetical protein